MLVAGATVVLAVTSEADVEACVCEVADVDDADETMCFGRAMDLKSMSSSRLFLLPFATELVCKAMAADDEANVVEVVVSDATIFVVSIAAGL